MLTESQRSRLLYLLEGRFETEAPPPYTIPAQVLADTFVDYLKFLGIQANYRVEDNINDTVDVWITSKISHHPYGYVLHTFRPIPKARESQAVAYLVKELRDFVRREGTTPDWRDNDTPLSANKYAWMDTPEGAAHADRLDKSVESEVHIDVHQVQSLLRLNLMYAPAATSEIG